MLGNARRCHESRPLPTERRLARRYTDQRRVRIAAAGAARGRAGPHEARAVPDGFQGMLVCAMDDPAIRKLRREQGLPRDRRASAQDACDISLVAGTFLVIFLGSRSTRSLYIKKGDFRSFAFTVQVCAPATHTRIK